MKRRVFLAGTAATASAGLAGCLSSVFSGSTGATDDVVLDEPEMYDQMRASRDNGDLAHPIHADELPDVTVPDATASGDISTHGYVGDRHLLLTFIFTRCTMVCPGLTASFAQIQTRAASNGYEDEVAFMPMTFDPEYDTPEVLEEYSTDMGAIPDDSHWHFLRPETPDEAEEIVSGEFGVNFWELSDEEREELEMPDNMVYDHVSAIILVNADGYVERTYTGSRVPNAAGLLDEFETLRERW